MFESLRNPEKEQRGGWLSFFPDWMVDIYETVNPADREEIDREVGTVAETAEDDRKAVIKFMLPHLLEAEDTMTQGFVQAIDDSWVLRALVRVTPWGSKERLLQIMPGLDEAFDIFTPENREFLSGIVAEIAKGDSEREKKMLDSIEDLEIVCEYVRGKGGFTELKEEVSDRNLNSNFDPDMGSVG